MKESKIEWCEHTFNPRIGCTKISPACDNCYAEADFDKRRHVVKWGAGRAGDAYMLRVGKKAAGRLLDGVTHDGRISQ